MRIKIGIPCIAESAWLPHTFEALKAQSWRDFEVWVCVNQPREFIHSPDHVQIVEDNRETLAWLNQEKNRLPFAVKVLDAVGPRSAPPQKSAGVGWARKHIFDTMIDEDKCDCLMVSLDADTDLDPHYLTAVAQAFESHENAVAMAAPYWHPLPDDERHALRLLRYEIFLRYYQLSLWRIRSPYAYLPLGSAMAFTRDAYVRVGGIPSRTAAEDFYFLQKMRKMGPVIRWIDALVYPTARPSFRVPFGTGVMINDGGFVLSRQRFPFYSQNDFQVLGKTFDQFRELYHDAQPLACHDFLNSRLGGYVPFDRMRRNARSETAFVRACHERFDALRTLQFLRFSQSDQSATSGSEEELNHLLSIMGQEAEKMKFSPSEIDHLEGLRRRLFLLESACQKKFMAQWDQQAAW